MDLERQIWWLRASLATFGDTGQRHQPDGRAAAGATGSRDLLLAGACAAGDRLERMAMVSGPHALWMSMALLDGERPTLVPCGVDLYGGLPGICLFLAYLADVTGEGRYKELAAASNAALALALEARELGDLGIGGFDGLGGLIYLYTHLASLWGEAAHLAGVSRLLSQVREQLGGAVAADVISGAAGCIKALLALHRAQSGSAALATAARCGDELLSAASPVDGGIGWVVDGMGERPLAGHTHGTAGIALALHELGETSGQERFSAAGEQALGYERRLCAVAGGRWPDLRTFGGDSQMEAWCHGAAGIGLARLRMKWRDDRRLHSEIGAAVDATLAYGFASGDCLCHGALGNLEFLHAVNECFHREDLSLVIESEATRCARSALRDDWRCGGPAAVETFGLMTGVAGIGFGLLRLAVPDRVPSVLTLDAPVA